MKTAPETEWIQLDEEDRQYVMSVLREHWTATGASALRIAAQVLFVAAPNLEHGPGGWPFPDEPEREEP